MDLETLKNVPIWIFGTLVIIGLLAAIGHGLYLVGNFLVGIFW